MELFTLAAEEKLLPGAKPLYPETKNTVLSGERAHFELVYRADTRLEDLTVEVTSDIKRHVTLRALLPVPATCVSMDYLKDADDLYVSKTPFLCPDVLAPVTKEKFVAPAGIERTLFVTLDEKTPAGTHEIRFAVKDANGDPLAECTYTLRVLRQKLGRCGVDYTNWFHYDSLAQYYEKPVFSAGYNRIMDAFIKDAVAHGMNTLLTPMFTPPLDTRIGGERLTVQLVDVEKTKDGWAFGFDRLIAFMRRVAKLGIEKYEMSHLFTQWGAKAAPKIVAKTENGTERVFGWDTPATGDAYRGFLTAFLPKLRERLIAEGLYEKCLFHVSDEPVEENMESYAAAREIAVALLPDAYFTDALSHYDFYERGLVTHPVPLTVEIAPFLQNGVENLWTYTCCGPCGGFYSNRLMGMSLVHLRVLGFCIYLANVKGFLHWGYNFYNSNFSDTPVNPYLVTDCDGAFPSGDAFIVYPGDDGRPVDSIRHETMRAALDDVALMKRVEEKIGRDAAVKILTDAGFAPDFKVPKGGFEALRAARAAAQKVLCKR